MMDLALNFLMGLEPGKMVALVMFAATVVLFPVVVKTCKGRADLGCSDEESERLHEVLHAYTGTDTSAHAIGYRPHFDD
ncbi:MAG: hypothetical protein HY804_10635 [Nitrospinae bacterium]|nr:hypothetical protein [Nitrospinota bacterium]